MNKRIVIGISAVILLLIGAGTYASYQKSQSTKKADAASLVSEQQFMEQMTSHHEDAIQMAEMAKERAKNGQVKALAGGIIAVQNKEVTNMKDWYKQWFSKDIPAMAAMPGMMDDGMDMGKLSSAKDFDLEFVSQMIPHHQKAVQMAKDILPKAKHSELKKMANDVITSQTMEIQEMQQLKKEFQDNPAGTATRKAIDCGDDSPGC
jgi:uncharacterized protein (DUF305 family)